MTIRKDRAPWTIDVSGVSYEWRCLITKNPTYILCIHNSSQWLCIRVLTIYCILKKAGAKRHALANRKSHKNIQHWCSFQMYELASHYLGPIVSHIWMQLCDRLLFGCCRYWKLFILQGSLMHGEVEPDVKQKNSWRLKRPTFTLGGAFWVRLVLNKMSVMKFFEFHIRTKI